MCRIIQNQVTLTCRNPVRSYSSENSDERVVIDQEERCFKELGSTRGAERPKSAKELGLAWMNVESHQNNHRAFENSTPAKTSSTCFHDWRSAAKWPFQCASDPGRHPLRRHRYPKRCPSTPSLHNTGFKYENLKFYPRSLQTLMITDGTWFQTFGTAKDSSRSGA